MRGKHIYANESFKRRNNIPYNKLFYLILIKTTSFNIQTGIPRDAISKDPYEINCAILCSIL